MGKGGPEIPVTVSVIGPTFVFSVSGLKANCSGEEARLLGKSRPIRSLASNNNNKKNCSAWELPHRGRGGHSLVNHKIRIRGKNNNSFKDQGCAFGGRFVLVEVGGGGVCVRGWGWGTPSEAVPM